MTDPDNRLQVLSHLVLTRLPAKSFFKMRCVCKTFGELSGDKRFLLTQSAHNNHASGFFIRDNTTGSLLDLIVAPGSGVPTRSLEFLKANAKLVGSAGGLVFFFDSFGLCVCNPARGTRCSIPFPPGEESYKVHHGSVAAVLGTDDTADYKLVYLTRSSDFWRSWLHCIRVYDSAAKGWTVIKEVDIGPRILDFAHPVVSGETVFWVSDCSSYVKVDPYIAAFDAMNGSARRIKLPKEASSDGFLGIAIWEETSLCLVHYNKKTYFFAVWLMKERKSGDGSVDWEKIHDIRLASMPLRRPSDMRSFILCNVLTSMALVFTVGNSAYSYTLNDDGELQELGRLTYWNPALIAYSNTLRPCGEQEEIMGQKIPFLEKIEKRHQRELQCRDHQISELQHSVEILKQQIQEAGLSTPDNLSSDCYRNQLESQASDEAPQDRRAQKR